jgi:hypothetical protein
LFSERWRLRTSGDVEAHNQYSFYAASVSLFLTLMHRAPQSHATIYWIDTIALTTSILLAALPIRSPIPGVPDR